MAQSKVRQSIPYLFVLLVGVGVTYGLCTNRAPRINFAAANHVRVVNNNDPPPRNDPSPAAVTLMVNLGWVGSSTPDGYNDAQPLNNPGGKEDPVNLFAWLISSPYLANFNTAVQFNTRPELVAILDVPDPSKLTKNALNLQAGPNCIFLWHKGADDNTKWDAYVLPPVVDAHGPNCPTPQPSPSDKIKAFGILFGANDQLPPAARFVEAADKDPVPGATLVGLKCGNQWCEIGGKNPKSTLHDGKNSSLKARIKGWHDEQRVWTIANGTLTLANFSASIVPDEDVADRDYSYYEVTAVGDPTGGWRRAALIYVADTTTPALINNSPYGDGTGNPKKNKRHLGLAPGVNTLWLKHRASDDQWFAQITTEPKGAPPTSTTTTLNVRGYMDHGNIPLPGVARWFWTTEDEDIWIPCSQGCCTIEGGELTVQSTPALSPKKAAGTPGPATAVRSRSKS